VLQVMENKSNKSMLTMVCGIVAVFMILYFFFRK
jgi:predicted RND superfamily exporter protein